MTPDQPQPPKTAPTRPSRAIAGALVGVLAATLIAALILLVALAMNFILGPHVWLPAATLALLNYPVAMIYCAWRNATRQSEG